MFPHADFTMDLVQRPDMQLELDYEEDEAPINPTFIAELLKDPSGTLQHVRELYNARVHGAHNEDLCKHMQWLAQALDSPKDLRRGTWSLLMKERLFDYYLDTVLAPDFFGETSKFVIAVTKGLTNLAQCASYMDDDKTVEYMIEHCSAIFKAIWDHRHLLQDLDNSRFESAFEWCTFHWADMYQTHRDHTAGVDTYIPHVALYAWVHLFKPDGASEMALAGMRFLSDRKRPCPEQTLERFTQEVVLDGIGGEAMLSRFERVLEDAVEPDNIEFLYTGEVLEALGVVSQLVKHPQMRTLVHKRETFRHIATYLNRRTYHGGEPDAENMGWTEWEIALFHFETMTEDLKSAFARKDMSHISIRGEDIVTFLACGTELLSRGTSRDKSRQIAAALHLYGLWAKSPEWRKLAPAFVDGLTRGAQADWIASLNALDAGLYRRGISERVYKDLVHAWKAFGTSTGLNESKERKRFDIQMRKFCSYSLCQFNRKEPETPLSSCKGCGEARYCGKECQRGDWKVHKKTCGKRLK